VNQLEAMQIFVRVAEQASFTRAAEGLGLRKTTVSGAVQALEGALGARLLHRTTRKVQMTQDGVAYYERCKELLAEFEELDGMFSAQRAGAARPPCAWICPARWRASICCRYCRGSWRRIR